MGTPRALLAGFIHLPLARLRRAGEIGGEL